MLILAFNEAKQVFFSTSGFGPDAAVRRALSATSRPCISGKSSSITQKETPMFECDRKKQPDPDYYVALQRDVKYTSKSKMFCLTCQVA